MNLVPTTVNWPRRRRIRCASVSTLRALLAWLYLRPDLHHPPAKFRPYNIGMDYRTELVRMITAGMQKPDVYAFFIGYDLEPWEVDQLLHDCGMHLPKRRANHDGISAERRRELQELSLSKET